MGERNADYTIWNCLRPLPDLNLNDKNKSAKVKNMMKFYILSDDKIRAIKYLLESNLDLGLKERSSMLQMENTFITERFDGTEKGEFISICAHSYTLGLTYVKLEPGSLPEIKKKDYRINAKVFEKPYLKIYAAFADCIKNFFAEMKLGGQIITAGFCTDFPLVRYSLDTAIIPSFSEKSQNLFHSKRDIRASFERVLSKDAYQGHICSSMLPYSDIKKSTKGISATTLERKGDSDAILEGISYDAKIVGVENVFGLKLNYEVCHEALERFKAAIKKLGEPKQMVNLEVSYSAIKITDKRFKDLLYHHSVHKISYISQDTTDNHLFGYVYGDLLEGHQFFGFKTETRSPEIILLLKDVFCKELLRKKKELLDTQASQVFLKLEKLLPLISTLKKKEIEIPIELRKKSELVEDINFWLNEKHNEEIFIEREEKVIKVNVSLQDIYCTAYRLKEKELEKLELEKRKDRRYKHKKKAKSQEPGIAVEKKSFARKKDEHLAKALEVFQNCMQHYANVFETGKKDVKARGKELHALKTATMDEKMNFIVKCKNTFIEDRKQRRSEVELARNYLEALESVESKIEHDVKQQDPVVIPNFKRFKLQIVKQSARASILDTFFGTQDDDVLAKYERFKEKSIEDFLITAYEMRKEEIEEINYLIDIFHGGKDGIKLSESPVVSSCRTLLIRAAKMRISEIRDIEFKLKHLMDADNEIFHAFHICKKIYKSSLIWHETIIKTLEEFLAKFPDEPDIEMSDVAECEQLYFELINLKSMELNDMESSLKVSKVAKKSLIKATNRSKEICHGIKKKREEELEIFVVNLEKIEAIENFEFEGSNNEVVDLITRCKEICLIGAAMREKEIDISEKFLESYKESTGTKGSEEESLQVTVTLKDVFNAALELEKMKCEKVLLFNKEKPNEETEILQVDYNFKNLLDVVVQEVQKKQIKEVKVEHCIPPDSPRIETSLEDFLNMAFSLKKKELEIPHSVIKRELERSIMDMKLDLRKKEKEKNAELESRKNALKILASWKEVFVNAVEMRRQEMEKVVRLKRKEIREETELLNELEKQDEQDFHNKPALVSFSLRRTFSVVIEMKKIEVARMLELIEKTNASTQQSKADGPELETFASDHESSASSENEGSVIEAYQQKQQEEEESKEESLEIEALRVIGTCKQIFLAAIEKGKSETEEMEYEMKPIFKSEFDAEKSTKTESEAAEALGVCKQVFLTEIEAIKMQIATMKQFLEVINKTQEKVDTQAAFVTATCRQFFNNKIERGNEECKNIKLKLDILDKSLKKLDPQSSGGLRPFTDLLVDEMSSDDEELIQEELLAMDAEIDDPESEVAEEEPEEAAKLTKSEIKEWLLEIAKHEKKGSEKEQMEKKEAIDMITLCQEQLQFGETFRQKQITKAKLELERLDSSEKENKKAAHAITVCSEIFNDGIDFRNEETRSMVLAMQSLKTTDVSEQDDNEFQASEIVESCRKLFLTAVEARRKSFSMMISEIEKLDKNKIDIEEGKIKKTYLIEIMKTEAFATCKELVLGSVEIKMKEIDDIMFELDILNVIQKKIDIRGKELDPETQKQACNKLEKAKDAVATCQKLCISSVEKSKKEVKAADKELEMLKGALESVEVSVVTSTCKQLFFSSIERRETEIELYKEYLEELKGEIEEKLENELEEVVKICTQHFYVAVERKQDQIDLIKSEMEKLKVTQQKVENEDNQAFGISRDVFLPAVDMRRDEIQSMEKELKILNRIIIEDEPAQVTTPQKPDAAQEKEESATSIALASSKRLFQTSIKMRRSEKDSMDFELVKLVRYQDSRIAPMCKQFLHTAIEKADQEVIYIEQKLKRLEEADDQSEFNLIAVCKDLFQQSINSRKKQIKSMEAELSSLKKTEKRVEMEDSRIIATCREVFSQIAETRRQEIGVMEQELDTLFEIEGHKDLDGNNYRAEIERAVLVSKEMCLKAIERREKEIETTELQLIQQQSLQIPEVIISCENIFINAIDSRKQDLRTLEQEIQRIEEVKAHDKNIPKDKVVASCTQFLQSSLGKRIQETKDLETALRVQKGKQVKKKEKKLGFDAFELEMKNQGTVGKLQTESSQVLLKCKEIMLSGLQMREEEIQKIDQAQTIIKSVRAKQEESLKTAVAASQKEEDLTPEELELRALEMEILKSAEAKDPESKLHSDEDLVAFCATFYDTTMTKREDEIVALKLGFGKLKKAEESLNKEAALSVLYCRKFSSDALQKTKGEMPILNTNLQKLIREKESAFDDCPALLNELENLFQLDIEEFEENLDVLKDYIARVKSKAMMVFASCRQLFLSGNDMLKREVKLLEQSLEVLRKDESEEEEIEKSKLSESEKIIASCKQYFASCLEARIELIRAVDLELISLRMTEESMQSMSVFPTWCELFLGAVNLGKDEIQAPNIRAAKINIDEEVAEYHFTRDILPQSIPQKLRIKMMNLKEIMESTEYNIRSQPHYIVSSWNDLFIRSVILKELTMAAVFSTMKEDKGRILTVHERKHSLLHTNWDDLLLLAVELKNKELEKAMELKKQKHAFVTLSSWNNLFSKAIDDWSTKMDSALSLMKSEVKLLQWRGQIQPDDYSQRLAACKPVDLWKRGIRTGIQFESQRSNIPDVEPAHQDSPKASKDENTKLEGPSEEQNKKVEKPTEGSAINPPKVTPVISSWNDIFTSAVELMKTGDEALHFLKSIDIGSLKDQNILTEIMNVDSSWNDLFIEATNMRKIELRKEIEETNALKELVKCINEKMHSRTSQLMDSQKSAGKSFQPIWSEEIFRAFELRRRDLRKSINIKQRELDKAKFVHEAMFAEISDEADIFLNSESSRIVGTARDIFAGAVEMKSKEIESMENELEMLQSIDSCQDEDTAECPESVSSWKEIFDIAVELKKKGKKIPSLFPRKRFSNKRSSVFFEAAKERKLKELEIPKPQETDVVQKTVSQNMIPTNSSWSKIFETAAQLRKKEIDRMAKLGITQDVNESDQESSCDDRDYISTNEGTELLASWSDLFLEAVDRKHQEMRNCRWKSDSSETSEIKTKNRKQKTEIRNVQRDPIMPSWNGIFFETVQCSKKEIQKKIFEEESDFIGIDENEMQKFANQTSSEFTSWEDLLLTVVELRVKEMEQEAKLCKKAEKIAVKMMKNVTLALLEKRIYEQETGIPMPKDIEQFARNWKLQKPPWSNLLPSEAEISKLEMENVLEVAQRAVAYQQREMKRKEALLAFETWMDLFPIAVGVRKKEMAEVLKFSKLVQKEQEYIDDKGKISEDEPIQPTEENQNGSTSGAAVKAPEESTMTLQSLQEKERQEAFQYFEQLERKVNKAPEDVVALWSDDVLFYKEQRRLEREKDERIAKEARRQAKIMLAKRYKNSKAFMGEIEKEKDQYKASGRKLFPTIVEIRRKEIEDSKKSALKKQKDATEGEFENIEPEYFRVVATWRELVQAALSQKKKEIEKIIDLKEQISDETETLQSAHFEASAAKVFDSVITLKELVKVVLLLKKNNMITIEKPIEVAEPEVPDVQTVEEEPQKAHMTFTDVFRFLNHIFTRALDFRNVEVSVAMAEMENLKDSELDESKKSKIMASEVFFSMKTHFLRAVEKRKSENCRIQRTLDKANNMQNILRGFIYCGSCGPLKEKNTKRIKSIETELDLLSKTLRQLENQILHHLESSKMHFISAIELRKEQIPVTVNELKSLDSLEENLEAKDMRSFANSKTILISAIDMKNKEITEMEIEKNIWEVTDHSSVENKALDIFSMIKNRFQKALSIRSQRLDDMHKELEYLRTVKKKLKIEDAEIYETCTTVFVKTIEQLRNEINNLETHLETISNIEKPQNKYSRSFQILVSTSQYLLNAIEARKIEIEPLDKRLKNIKKTETAQIFSECTTYLENSLQTRRDEIKITDANVDDLHKTEKKLRPEAAEAKEEISLADVLSDLVQIGRPSIHTLISQEKVNKHAEEEAEELKIYNSCIEVYTAVLDHRRNEMKEILQNLDSLKDSKDKIKSQALQTITYYRKSLQREIATHTSEIKSLGNELKGLKLNQIKIAAEVLEFVGNLRKKYIAFLAETKLELEGLTLEHGLVSKKCSEIEDFEDYESDDNADVSMPKKDKVENESVTKSEIETKKKKEETVESRVLAACKVILQKVYTMRTEQIDSILNEEQSLNETQSKPIFTLSTCHYRFLVISEERIDENQSVSSILEVIKQCEESQFLNECKYCLYDIIDFNKVAQDYVNPVMDSLNSDVENENLKADELYQTMEEVFQFALHSRWKEIEHMSSELTYLTCLETSEDPEIFNECKAVFQKALKARQDDIETIREKQDFFHELRTDRCTIEALTIIEALKEFLSGTAALREEETDILQYYIHQLVEYEDAMLNLVYTPSFQTVVIENSNFMSWLQPQLRALEEKYEEFDSETIGVVDSCRSMYLDYIETLRMEKEATLLNIEILENVTVDQKESFQPEVGAIVVSFRNLFNTAFDLKKKELEKAVQKKEADLHIRAKAKEIRNATNNGHSDNMKHTYSLVMDSTRAGISSQDKTKEMDKSQSAIQSEFDFGDIKCDNFITFIRAKRKARKAAIEKAMEQQPEKETDDKESDIESEIKSKSSRKAKSKGTSSPKESVEEPLKAETYGVGEFEARIKEIEEEVLRKRTKINITIEKRRIQLENIITAKKIEMEKNIESKKKEMKHFIDFIKEKQDSQVVCNLKDIFHEVVKLKDHGDMSFEEKEKDYKARFNVKVLQGISINVKLSEFMIVALELKEKEKEMAIKSKQKQMEKSILLMKMEMEKLTYESKHTLENLLDHYKIFEKNKAMDRLVTLQKKRHVQHETKGVFTHSDELLPDFEAFKKFASQAMMAPFTQKTENALPVYNDLMFRSDEIVKNKAKNIALYRERLPTEHTVIAHILDLLKMEVEFLKKGLFYMEWDKAKAVLHGISFLKYSDSSSNIVRSSSPTKMQEREIILDVIAAMNANTSMLMFGSYVDEKCDIALNLDRDCDLVYFEKIERVKKWIEDYVLEFNPQLKEVVIDTGLRDFGNDGSLDFVCTELDWGVTTVPFTPSRLEKFIGDLGLLEQLKFAFLELHHQQLLCRFCEMGCTFQEIGFSVENLCQISNAKNDSEIADCIPREHGIVSEDDGSILRYLSQLILYRGALITSIVLCSVINRLDRDDVTVVIKSRLIEEHPTYQSYIKAYASILAPGKKISFLPCRRSTCGIGAAITTAIASRKTRERPQDYLLQLEKRFVQCNRLFSVYGFLRMLQNPELEERATKLAWSYMVKMKFEVPLSVVWAHKFMSENYDAAEEQFKECPVTLTKVDFLVCREFRKTGNIEMGKQYIAFLNKYGLERQTKGKAYKTLIDLLFDKEMYKDAILLVEECTEMGIPIHMLRYSTLSLLYDFFLKEMVQTGRAQQSFPLPIQGYETSSSDSDVDLKFKQDF